MYFIIFFNVYHYFESKCNQISLIFIIWLKQDTHNCIIEYVDLNVYIALNQSVSI